MRHFQTAFTLAALTSIISLASTTTASAQFPTAGWLNRATGGRVTTPRPIQNMTPFQIRPAPTSSLPGENGRQTWGNANFKPVTVGRPNRNPNANLKINAGTQRKSLYSIKNNGRVYRGNQLIGQARKTSTGWIALGPGATFIQKKDGSTRTTAGNYFK